MGVVEERAREIGVRYFAELLKDRLICQTRLHMYIRVQPMDIWSHVYGRRLHVLRKRRST